MSISNKMHFLPVSEISNHSSVGLRYCYLPLALNTHGSVETNVMLVNLFLENSYIGVPMR